MVSAVTSFAELWLDSLRLVNCFTIFLDDIVDALWSKLLTYRAAGVVSLKLASNFGKLILMIGVMLQSSAAFSGSARHDTSAPDEGGSSSLGPLGGPPLPLGSWAL